MRDTSISKLPRLRSRMFAGLTALCVCLGAAGPARAGMSAGLPALTAITEEPEILRVRVELDASACGEEAGAIEARVSSDLEGLFLELSVLPGGEDSPALELVITPFENPESPGYDAKLVFLVDGERVEASATSAACDLCTHGELAAKVSELSRAAIDRARAGEFQLQAEPAVTEPANPEGPEPGDERPPPVVEPVKPRPLGALGYTGIAASVLGAGFLGGGAALLAKGDEYIDGGLREKQRRGPGAALIGVGAGALITGVALIVVDRIRAKKAAKR